MRRPPRTMYYLLPAYYVRSADPPPTFCVRCADHHAYYVRSADTQCVLCRIRRPPPRTMCDPPESTSCAMCDPPALLEYAPTPTCYVLSADTRVYYVRSAKPQRTLYDPPTPARTMYDPPAPTDYAPTPTYYVLSADPPADHVRSADLPPPSHALPPPYHALTPLSHTPFPLPCSRVRTSSSTCSWDIVAPRTCMRYERDCRG